MRKEIKFNETELIKGMCEALDHARGKGPIRITSAHINVKDIIAVMEFKSDPRELPAV